ncbi:pilus assembly protein N-terminal domain-containing protein [Archangium violaceum]|uniref:pilus assembly protein N-terminal domain-containing protein n=1 Tax=Archangium violaceum TaxID=83451 RepID=UPI00194E6D95|nr:pilus assembly protein N-terminal domain-containing protein [Archangium violaceum]QRN97359.1 pilus assembly protein N-terminal domain-containing protein [Archangium violaceum]
MYAKKMVGVAVVLTVTLFGSGVGASEQPPAPASAQDKVEKTITLMKGEGQTLEVKNLVRVAIGDPEVAEVTFEGPDDRIIRLTGSKKGETTLLVWTKDGARKAYRIVTQG